MTPNRVECVDTKGASSQRWWADAYMHVPEWSMLNVFFPKYSPTCHCRPLLVRTFPSDDFLIVDGDAMGSSFFLFPARKFVHFNAADGCQSTLSLKIELFKGFASTIAVPWWMTCNVSRLFSRIKDQRDMGICRVDELKSEPVIGLSDKQAIDRWERWQSEYFINYQDVAWRLKKKQRCKTHTAWCRV